ncbi:MAG: Asp-tRNA(Asn)/Glu-tRNA(Gln) amidotransferase subunit GatA [Candidatus Abyssobacteria bacterium SURF_5]|uniref:Glutamyl-tRNA(Gln) amidotransferase subunit A n=1 Tax=Abyssobacteria bacterium (strain SURF_5) TaxID=2093360 RepID=A0A3A4N7J7_ABYX5|nr:MAG: Asp-tRNA(Asn)/Glu-tRNA(Gln) amidotransferase subunit GatA [Candidatus Abyssubacteria bacterium SURF_5]
MPNELCDLTISELGPMIKSRKISPVELLRSVLHRIEKLEPRLKAYITVDHDAALQAARKAERQIKQNRYLGPLHGIPISLKDLYQTKGLRTSGGSKILQEWVPDEDATSVAKLREAGAVIAGKTNLHEFAFGGTTQNPHFGGARNPYNLARIPGGSSGGSAAAVAAGMCIAATGSDTGGSIRTPSALCGIVGLKPTYGRVSLHGIIPLAWSLDHIGPMTKCVRDAAVMLSAMAGYDPKDPSSACEKVPRFERALKDDVKKLKIGIEPAFCFNGADDEVEQAVRRALSLFERLGAKIVEVNLPNIELTSPIESVIITAEAASYHEENLRNRPLDFGEDVRVLLEAGAAFTAVHYLKAQRIRSLIRKEFADAFRKIDVFALPAAAVPAPKIGAQTVSIKGMETDAQMALLRYTCPSNLTGLPAISIPCGMSGDGLPIGLQLVGKAFDEATLLRAAFAFEAHVEPLPKPALT